MHASANVDEHDRMKRIKMEMQMVTYMNMKMQGGFICKQDGDLIRIEIQTKLLMSIKEMQMVMQTKM